MLTIIFYNILLIAGLMFVVWGCYLKTGNASIIDCFWSIIIAVSGVHYLLHQPLTVVSSTFMLLLIIWAARLAGYLLITRIIPKHQDKRYQDISDAWQMPKKWGYLLNFQMQGGLGIVIATPFLFISQLHQITAIQLAAILIIIIGVTGESVADWQLQAFRRRAKGQVCNVGLWSYSRHPNYFFDCCVWFGFALAGLTASWGWCGFISPLFLAFLMLYITIPITENTSIASKGDHYRKYQRTTAKFIPWPPGSE